MEILKTKFLFNGRLLILSFLFIGTTNIFGQRTIITPSSPQSFIIHGSDFNRNSALATVPYDALTPYVMNVYFTLFNNSGNNSLGTALDTPEEAEDRFLECIKFLNIHFNASNIFFKYDGFQILNNSAIANNDWVLSSPPQAIELYADNDISKYTKVNALNFVFFDMPAIQIDWFSFLGLNASLCTTSMLTSPLLEKQIVHKMGHTLSLYHIYQTGSHFQPGHPLYDFTACEHITRDPNLASFNADIAGDEVADTPAQPAVTDSNFQSSCGSYILLSAGTNCESLPYINIVNGNFMGNITTPTVCQLSFTAGQTRRMRESILNSPNIQYSPDLPGYTGVIESTRNTVASLFRPYSMGQIVFPQVLSTTDNGDGTAKVCRGYNSADFKFQPGFTYTFLEEPDPNAPIISSISENQNPVIIHEPAYNCAFFIGELASSQTNLSSNMGQVETVCRGEVCVNEPFVRATDIRTQILGSMNMTIKEFDAIEAKDPELYNKLLEQYYHILEKFTASGAKTLEVFYKN
jgi:hypothetical protein